MSRDRTPWMNAAGKIIPASQLSFFSTDTFAEAPKHAFSRDERAPVGAHRKGDVDENVRYGRKNEYDSSAAACLYDSASCGVAAVAREVAERNYATKKREPLGKPSVQNWELPEKTKGANFVFGRPAQASESAKRVIYSTEVTQPDDCVGTAKTRGYNWATVNIDPTTFRFGSAETRDADATAKAAMHYDIARPSKLVPIEIAHSSTLGTTTLAKSKQFGFAIPTGTSKRIPSDSVRDLLAQPFDPKDDVGRPVCRSATLRKLQTALHDQHRVFGCPSIRYDLPKPAERKVTNENNYGDDASAASLLRPSPFLNHSVEESRSLNQDQAISIAKKCGLAQEDVATIAAQSADGITVGALRVALSQL